MYTDRVEFFVRRNGAATRGSCIYDFSSFGLLRQELNFSCKETDKYLMRVGQSLLQLLNSATVPQNQMSVALFQ